MTVSQLPSLMRQQLMIERKYIFTFFEICTCLCQMGLLSFGRREWKDKEQVLITGYYLFVIYLSSFGSHLI